MSDTVQALGGWGGVAGWCVAIVGPLLTYLATRRKSDIDESTLVLNQWKLLFEAHKQQMDDAAAAHKKQLDAALADYERRMSVATHEITQLRDKIGAQEKKILVHEERIAALEEENRALRTENEGYKRQIAQKSQSEVTVLGPAIGANAPTARKRFQDPDRDLLRRLDKGMEE